MGTWTMIPGHGYRGFMVSGDRTFLIAYWTADSVLGFEETVLIPHLRGQVAPPVMVLSGDWRREFDEMDEAGGWEACVKFYLAKVGVFGRPQNNYRAGMVLDRVPAPTLAEEVEAVRRVPLGSQPS